MGLKEDKEAVVNPRLRVYGIEGLRVVDVFIMPIIPRGNINAPTIMIAEKASDERQYESEEYDFIIVGAGSAGCVLANRLSEINGWTVLLLEAGGDEPEAATIPAFAQLLQGTDIDWNYKTQPEQNACLKNNGCDWPRGKVVGGSSSINYMAYVRGNREDYDSWATQGNSGWSYQDVLPYFKKSEDNRDKSILLENPHHHNTGGYQTVERYPYLDQNAFMLHNALQELGYNNTDVNSEHQLGVMNVQYTSINGSRQSTNGAFIRPIRQERTNLFLKKQAYVTKILIDENTKKATGVEYTSIFTGISKIVMAKKEVIVSAGAVNSPKLLMLSGVGPVEELKKYHINVIQNLSVGHNLQDHISFLGISVTLNNKTSTDSDCEQKVKDLYDYWKTNKGPLSGNGVTSITAFARTQYAESQYAPDIQFLFGGHGNLFPYYNGFSIFPVLLTPESRGKIRLNETDPVWGKPLIYPRYYNSEMDTNRTIKGVRLALKLFDTDIFKENDYKLVEDPLPPCNQSKFNSDEYWYCVMKEYTTSIFHPVGTCKMGPKEDLNAVVDSRLRVYGIKGLRVIDASIMPTVPRGNTNAPTIMIAEKGSDMIKQDWL